MNGVMIRVGCALFAGLALWVSFPSTSLWWAAPLGLALLAAVLTGTTVWRGALLGLLAGLACFVPTLSWSGIYVGALPWGALATLESLYVAAGCAAAAFLQGRGSRGSRGDGGITVRPLGFALAWTTAEFARATTPFGGFPWARVAFGQIDGPIAPLAALVGAPGVTFVVALVGGLVAAAGFALVRRRALPAASAALGALALVLAGLVVPLPTDGTPGRFVAIQGNVPQAGLDFNEQRRAVLDNHATVTKEAAAQARLAGLPRPDLVLWPENASDIDPLRNADARAVIADAVAAVGAPTVVGAVLTEPVGMLSNSSLLYEPDGRIAARYDKQRPAPFAEYIPYRSFFRMFSDKVDLVQRDFAKGAHTGVFRVPAAAGGTIAAGTSICFEVIFDDLVRDQVDQGANVLTVQTNNATFGLTDESEQQLAVSRFRAIEHGRSVVHISNVGVSALVTPDGTPHGSTSLFTSAVLRGDLPLRTETTLATRLGPWPERAAAALLVVLLAAAMRQRRSR